MNREEIDRMAERFIAENCDDVTNVLEKEILLARLSKFGLAVSRAASKRRPLPPILSGYRR